MLCVSKDMTMDVKRTERQCHEFIVCLHRKLSHEKLVKLCGVVTQRSPIYLVFEFMENGCLTDFLRAKKGCLSQEVLLEMCLDVSEGMAYLESSNFIHRDLVGVNRMFNESISSFIETNFCAFVPKSCFFLTGCKKLFGF